MTAGEIELVDLAAELGDLAHEGAGDELVLVAGGQEHGFHVRHQAAVHAGELEFVIEIGHRTQAAHHRLGARATTKSRIRPEKLATSTCGSDP